MLKSFGEFITEGSINLIGANSREKRLKYVDEVWDMLQAAYKSIGGIKGSGFRSKEDMVDTIPFWKILKHNGKIVLVIMYKDKEGRKSVAFAIDKSSPVARKKLIELMKNDLDKSWTERSGAPLDYVAKYVPLELLKKYLIKPEVVATYFEPGEVEDVDYDRLSADDKKLYHKLENTIFKDYFYTRTIGGAYLLKAALGTVGKAIK